MRLRRHASRSCPHRRPAAARPPPAAATAAGRAALDAGGRRRLAAARSRALRRRRLRPTSARCPSNERQALAHMIRAAQVMDALFLSRSGPATRRCCRPAARPERRRPGPPALFPDQQGAVVAARPQRAVRPRRAAESRRRPTTIPPAPRKEEVEKWLAVAAGAGREGARHGLLHDHSPRPRRRLRRRALQHRIPGRAGACRDAPARGGGAHDAADAQGVPGGARGRVPLERLLRQRREVDGARRHRSSRPSAPTRSTRTSGSTTRRRSRRSSPSRTSRVAKAAEVRRRAAGHRGQPADRSEVPQPEARRAGPDRRRQHGVLGRRRQPRRADGRVQPAQRRAGRSARRAASG